MGKIPSSGRALFECLGDLSTLDIFDSLSDRLCVKTNLADFQKFFRKAREAADRGETVIIESDGKRYVFESMSEPRNPFQGLEDVLGQVHLGKREGSGREKIRQRLARKHRR